MQLFFYFLSQLTLQFAIDLLRGEEKDVFNYNNKLEGKQY